MEIPAEPPVGYLISYEYLWLSKAQMREDGESAYPTAIVAARRDVGPASIAYALGISHKRPLPDERALEVPRKLKRWLGLDGETSWLYTDQVNIFVWPGPDLRPGGWLSNLPSARESCVIAALPADWFEMVKGHLTQSYHLQKVKTVKRTF